MTKSSDTRRPCEVGARVCNSLPEPPPHLVFVGCGRLLHTLTPTSQGLLVSLRFGMVSSLHLSSFL